MTSASPLIQFYGKSSLYARDSLVNLSGRRIHLVGTIDTIAITDSSGSYLFKNVPNGLYSMTEEMPPAWNQNIPPPLPTGDDSIEVRSLAMMIHLWLIGENARNYRITPVNAGGGGNFYSGYALPESLVNDAFATYSTQTISAKQISFGATCLADPGTHLTLIFDTTSMSQINASGNFAFRQPKDRVVLNHLPLAGYSTYSPPPLFDFKSSMRGEIHGTVFSDEDSSGRRDAGEPGVAGWKVYLAGPVIDSTVTDADGEYQFINLPAGSYIVAESYTPNYVQTEPSFNAILPSRTAIIDTMQQLMQYMHRLAADAYRYLACDMKFGGGGGGYFVYDIPQMLWRTGSYGYALSTNTSSTMTFTLHSNFDAGSIVGVEDSLGRLRSIALNGIFASQGFRLVNTDSVRNDVQSVDFGNKSIRKYVAAIRSIPPGLSFRFDSTEYTSPQTIVSLQPIHALSADTIQNETMGSRFAWKAWNDGGAASHLITLSDSSAYVATFSAEHFVTLVAGAHGTVTPTNGWIGDGHNILLAAVPDTGYHFSGWQGAGSGAYNGMINPHSITVNNPLSDTAFFAIDTFSIRALSGENGSITPSGSVDATYGTDWTFIFNPITGYHVDSVIVDGVLQTEALSHFFSHITGNHTIRVTFAINQYTILAQAGAHGKVFPCGSVGGNFGANMTFTSVPDPDFRVDSVIVDGVRTDSVRSYTFHDVRTNHSIITYFSPDMHTISLAINERWNLVSVPLRVNDYAKTVLFPTALSNAFAYEGSYVAYGTLQNRTGYWMKFNGSQSISMSGLPHNDDTLNVAAGWNLVGSISSPLSASSIVSMPGGIVTSKFFGYTTSYQTTDTLQPGAGYWVKVNQSGKLILSSAPVAAPSAKISIVSIDELPPAPPDQIPSNKDALPTSFGLSQNYPNPFNPSTTISFSVRAYSHIRIEIFNMVGEKTATIIDKDMDAGFYSAHWEAGSQPSGIYVCRMQAGTFQESRKLILMK